MIQNKLRNFTLEQNKTKVQMYKILMSINNSYAKKGKPSYMESALISINSWMDIEDVCICILYMYDGILLNH